ncbi:DNA-directed RNA polymerase subunit alpha [Candidatus Collierbacteria bacterium]|nr:DNA-directed RNA polymerase subunit alpha [Candidatus Collierbacteria bacterium]
MIKPNFKLTVNPLANNTAEVIIEPLPKNFGHTIGNALRRVLLSSLSGSAPTQVKIAGVTHQFSTLEGLQEDTLEFILNLKQVRFALDNLDSANVKINVSGQRTVTAADLELPSGVTVSNPDQVLAHLTSAKSKLSANITVQTGIGYVPAEENGTINELGAIPLDASFSPVLRVNYSVEATRVGRRADLDKVRLLITTNNTIDPETAVIQASQILTDFFTHFHSPVFETEEEMSLTSGLLDQEQSIEELDLPTRVTNALKKGGYKNLADLGKASLNDLIKVKNMGEKSASLVVKKSKAKGIMIK